MKFGLVCVNYNSYDHLITYVRSLATACRLVTDLNFRLVIVDNSTSDLNSDAMSEIYRHIGDFDYIKCDNIGYFPAANLGLSRMSGGSTSYDYVAVSNVDLEMRSDFFENLSEYVLPNEVGVLAPSIVSSYRKSDLNPKIIFRPNRGHLCKNIFLFKIPVLFWLYGALSDLKFRMLVRYSRDDKSVATEHIYAPHGSFMVFTKSFFSRGGNLNYPRFLFGEEIFIGEECAARSLSINYVPSLVVLDLDHGSTSLRSRSFIAGEHVKSLRYLVKKYFTEKSA